MKIIFLLIAFSSMTFSKEIERKPAELGIPRAKGVKVEKVLMGYKIHDTALGVVCYSTMSGGENNAISCVKINPTPINSAQK